MLHVIEIIFVFYFVKKGPLLAEWGARGRMFKSFHPNQILQGLTVKAVSPFLWASDFVPLLCHFCQ